MERFSYRSIKEEPHTKRAPCLPLLLVVIAVFVPAYTHYYVKPGQTAAVFNRDKRDCERLAKKEAYKRGTRPCDETEKCLEAKGWTRG